MSRFPLRLWHIAPLIIVVVVLSLWTAVRLVGWPPLNNTPPYVVVRDWPKLPAGLELGQVTGIDVDSQGRVFVFARVDKVWDSEPIDPSIITPPTVYIFDGQTGDLEDSWGDGRFVMPHGLTIDQDDNVWLTDVGLHQVYKFSSDGNLLLTMGQSAEAGSDQTHFNRPTDVAVAPDGGFFVSDGYLNTRVVRFDKDGRYLLEWGSPGSETGQFDLPHSLALDDAGQVYVADRSNGRVQIFDENGRFLAEWQDAWRIGRPWAIRLDQDGLVYVVDGGDQNAWFPDRARIIILREDGQIVRSFGSYGSKPGQFIWPHAVAIGPDGAIYVAEVGQGRRVQKLIRQKAED